MDPISPGGLQPLEAQPDHRGPAEHTAQVQGLHTLGCTEGHAGQDVLWGQDCVRQAVLDCLDPWLRARNSDPALCLPSS